ncbi:Gamma-tubulin complex component 3 [Boothiomyces macroporosus]|uniref:Gamma-tubulin complex component 3 n=1 Tax=Boothiomyces macroporosus TaxID=261099 RepID=A0AAD5UFG7_9FUNG|nr:Gamma-tubulin complex component 3 [Boothiomyces macroporosus]
MLGNESTASNELLNEGSTLISKALFRIVLRYMTKNGKESPRLSSVYEYCLRILGSRLQPTILRDQGHLMTDMNSIQKSWEVLYFLYAVSDHPQTAFTNISMIKVPKTVEPQERKSAATPQKPSVPSASVFSSYYSPPQSQLDGKAYLTEKDLIRELLFVFQAIDGKYIKYVSKSKRFEIDERVALPSPTISLVNKLSIVGELSKDIEERLSLLKKGSTTSIFQQSLLSSIQDEMQDFSRQLFAYFRLIAILEGQIEKKDKNDAFIENDLSLKRLFVWTNGPLVRLRLLNQILELCSGTWLINQRKKGFQNTINHSQVGGSWRFDYPRIYNKAAPKSELDDPFGEFFVGNNLNADSDNVWKSRYLFKNDMLPSFLPETLAMKQLLTYGDLKKLEFSIDSSYKSTTNYLMNILFTKYELVNRFEELKAYLLLGQGDFAQYLMDNLQYFLSKFRESLSKSAGTIYRHNLTGTLESALRFSNPNYEATGLQKRLDIRLSEV